MHKHTQSTRTQTQHEIEQTHFEILQRLTTALCWAHLASNKFYLLILRPLTPALQYYATYNTLEDTKTYLSREVAILASVQDNYKAALLNEQNRANFLKSIDTIRSAFIDIHTHTPHSIHTHTTHAHHIRTYTAHFSAHVHISADT